MKILEANLSDSAALQALQARCPQGLSLSIYSINTPDFFARAKAYEAYKVFTAYDANDMLLGSAAVGLRTGRINGEMQRLGYEFQYFTAPEARQRGVAQALRGAIEEYLRAQNVALTYAMIIDGNLPSMHLFERQGFYCYRKLPNIIWLPYKKMPEPGASVRTAKAGDLAAIAELYNTTWRGHAFAEELTAQTLTERIERLHAFTLENLLVLEENGRLVAALGYWDWSQITQIRIKSLSPSLRWLERATSLAGKVVKLPKLPRKGDIMRQWCLTPIACEQPVHLQPLLARLNNLAIQNNIGQILALCEKDSPLQRALKLKGSFQTSSLSQIYVKPLIPQLNLNDVPLFIDSIDL
jgi:L-amino acid N-acyltransferase YncA